MDFLIAYFARQKLFSILSTVFIILLGIASAFLIRRETFPNVSFDTITISTIYPGAAAEEVEKLITNKIEQDIKEVDGIKKLLSVSTESRSYIIAQLDPDVTTEQKGKDDIQTVVDRVKAELPEDAEDPQVVVAESKLNPIVEIALSSDELSDSQLREEARKLENHIETLSGVARVVVTGLRKKEIHIEADLSKLAMYRVSLEDVIAALRNQNVSIPAGGIEVQPGENKKEKIIRTIGEYKSVQEIENTVIRANDASSSIRIKQIARVIPTLEKAQVVARTDGQRSLSLTVLKKEKSDAIDLVKGLKKGVDSFRSKMHSSLKLEYINDMSVYIQRRLDVLSGNLLVGMVLILLVLPLMLPFRASIIIACGLPFAFLATLVYFQVYGYSINLLSMLGLIIASGMLVDNGIVIADNTLRKMEEGEGAESASITGTQQVWISIAASSLTTILAFAPLLFMTGIFGKFVKQIPVAVLVSLGVSLVQAFFVFPAIFSITFKNYKVVKSEDSKGIGSLFARFWDSKIVPYYLTYLRKAIRFRYGVALLLVVMFVGTLGFAKSKMKFILFPPDGIEIFFVRFEAPLGTSLLQLEELVKPIEAEIKKLPNNELDVFLTKLGIAQQNPNDPNTSRGSHVGQIAVYLTPETERTRIAGDIMNDLREKVGKQAGLTKVSFERVQNGPPVGKPVSVGVRGTNYEDIVLAVQALKEKIRQLNGVKDVEDDYTLGKEEIRVKVDPVEAASAGLSVAQVGSSVRAAYDGIVASSISELDEEIDLRVSLDSAKQKNEESLSQLRVPNRNNNLVYLNTIAKFESGQSLASFNHEANQRQIKVSADVDTNVTSSQAANAEIRKFLPELNAKFPNVRIAFGGEDEDTQESMKSLIFTFGSALFGILFTLILLYQNILQPLLILITIPLGIIAVIWAFYFNGLPLSFMGTLGIISLAGVIVNNAIIFVDFVNQERAAGKDRYESIYESAKLRVRPIFLTTVTTVMGLLPTAYGIGGLDKFVVPIAMALGWGLAFGSVLTVFFFPAILSILDDFVALVSKKFKRA